MIPCTIVITLISGFIIGLGTHDLIAVAVSNAIISLLLVLVVSSRNYRRYMKPSMKIIATLRDIAIDCDLNKRMPDDINGELSDVRSYFNQFMEKLHLVVCSIDNTTSELNKSLTELLHAAENTASASNGTSDGARAVDATLEEITGSIGTTASVLTETSGRMEDISHTVEEMSQHIRNLASAAEETSVMVGQVSEFAAQISTSISNTTGSAKEVSHSVSSVATAVKEINISLNEISKNCERSIHITQNAGKSASNTDAIIEKLNNSSKQIGKIVNVINEIADQTNMLALNAAIEAAGAGEAGKGFAVVANEVKELAKQTAEATEEISDQIGEMQANMAEAVKATANITEVINEITLITGTIASAVTEQSATTGGISIAVMNAAERVGYMTGELEDIDGNARHVRGNMSEAASGVDNMASSASSLSDAYIGSVANIEWTASRIREISDKINDILAGTREISKNMGRISAAASAAAGDSADASRNIAGLMNTSGKLVGHIRNFNVRNH